MSKPRLPMHPPTVQALAAPAEDLTALMVRFVASAVTFAVAVFLTLSV